MLTNDRKKPFIGLNTIKKDVFVRGTGLPELRGDDERRVNCGMRRR